MKQVSCGWALQFCACLCRFSLGSSRQPAALACIRKGGLGAPWDALGG